MNPGRLFIVSAPSGAGKTTLVQKAIEALKDKLSIERVIGYTTKSPRPGDKHGQDYYFISQEEFLDKIREGFFIEYSTAYGNYYGTPGHILNDLATGKSYILVIDRAGAKQVKQKNDKVVLIWIDIPDIKTLENRLILRNTETEKQLKERLKLAQEELLEEKGEKFYQFHICNDVLETALQELISVISAQAGLRENLK